MTDPTHRRILLLLPFCGLLLFLPGCGKPSEAPEEDTTNPESADVGPDIVATYDPEKSITRSDVDSAILGAPVADRLPGEIAYSEWYGRWVSKLFLDDVLHSEALENELDRGPDFLAESRTLRRSIYTESKIRAEGATLPPITEEEIDARFEEQKSALEVPESRLIYHIYRRFDNTPERSREKILAQLESVRSRVANGENFRNIAHEISDSELRFKQGLLGQITRGQLAEAADEVIFSLPEGEVSEPLITKDGAHLFFNENTTVARSPSLEELRSRIKQELIYLRGIEILQSLAEAGAIKTTRFTPDDEKVKKLLTARDPKTILFALGTYELKLGEFRQILRTATKKLAGVSLPVDDISLAIYNEIKNREILFQSMLADTEADYSDLDSRVEAGKKELLIQQQMRNRMVAWLDARTDLLQEYFRNNRKRFEAPDRVRLQGLRIPIETDAATKMSVLEKAKTGLESGEVEWDSVAASVGGEISDWGWFRPNELAAADVRAAKQAFGMKVGDISAPYTNLGMINMFEIVNREKSIPTSFDRSRPQIINLYLSKKAEQVRKEVIAELEEKYSFREYPSHFPDPLDALGGETDPTP